MAGAPKERRAPNQLYLRVEKRGERQQKAVYLDLNKYLPDGTTLNPKFLEPYGESQRFKVNNLFEALEGRAGVALVYDQTRFGDFRANIIAGERFVESAVQHRIWAMQRNADARQRPYLDAPFYRYYWSDNGTAYPDPATVTYAAVPGGPTQTYSMMDMLDLTRTASQRKGSQDFTYLQSSLNARLFKGRVNLTVGARRDSVVIASKRMTTAPRAEQYAANWDGITKSWLPKAPADFYKLQYQLKNADASLQGPDYFEALSRPRDAAGNPLPQYARDRFKSDYSVPDIKTTVNTVSWGGVVHVLPWLSGYYNFAVPILRCRRSRSRINSSIRSRG